MSSETPPPALRIGDKERHAAVDQLSAAFAEGRLTPEEFDERSTSALAARTSSDLDALLVDLRPRPATAPLLPAPDPGRPARRGEQRFVAIMSGVERQSRWTPAPAMKAVAVMGGVELDFRGASVTSRNLELTAVAFMGGVDITVPEDWEVSMSGLAFMGGRDIQGSCTADEPAVRLHVSGWAVMGGVVIKHKPGEASPRSLSE